MQRRNIHSCIGWITFLGSLFFCPLLLLSYPEMAQQFGWSSESIVRWSTVIGALVVFAYILFMSILWGRRLGLIGKRKEADFFEEDPWVFEVSLPKDNKWDPSAAKKLMEHLLAGFPRMIFQIVGEFEKISWRVLIPSNDLGAASTLVRSIKTIYPQALVSDKSGDDVSSSSGKTFWREVMIVHAARSFCFPVLSLSSAREFDPLKAIVQAMSGLEDGERVVYSVCVSGTIDKWKFDRGVKQTQIKQSSCTGSTFGLLVSPLRAIWALMTIIPRYFWGWHWMLPEPQLATSGTGRTKKGRYIEAEQNVIDSKLYDNTIWDTHILVEASVLQKKDLNCLSDILTVLLEQYRSDYNLLIPTKRASVKPQLVNSLEQEKATNTMGVIERLALGRIPYKWSRTTSSFDQYELAALWHLPHEDFSAEEIAWIPAGQVSLPQRLARNTQGILLGNNVYGDREIPVRMLDDDRKTHVNIIGMTGVGKSTFMHHLIHQDIADGKGVGVVDPHGKLVSDILRFSIPEERIGDVVLLDIANEENPPPLNPLLVPGENNRLAAGQVVAVLDKIYEIKAQRAEDAMTAAFITLAQEKTPTVRDVVKLFTDVEYRYQFLDNVDDLVAQEFWEEFENQSPSFQRDLSYPIVHRMRHFYRNPILYPVMCHPDALDFSDLMRSKKIILISLAADERKIPKPEQQLLGAVLVSQLQLTGMVSRKSRNPFYLYIDEVQNFVTSGLENMLTAARKYKLYLTISNQYLGQLRGKTLDSVIGNVGATVVFQTGLVDAKALAPHFRPNMGVENLLNLPLFNAVVKMRFRGNTQPTFSIETLPPYDIDASEEDLKQAREREEMIRRVSVENYTPKTRADVHAWLEDRYPPPSFGRYKKGEGSRKPDDWVVTED